MPSHNVLQSTFYLKCLLSTLSMLFFVSVRFYNDESVTSVDFQSYHNRKQDIYPSISFCLTMETPHNKPWYHTNLALYDTLRRKQHIPIASREGLENYIRFLLGNDSSSKPVLDIKDILNINYDNITVDLKQYLDMIKVESADDVIYEWNKNNGSNPMKTSYRHGLIKCISLNFSEEVMPGITNHILFSTEFTFLTNNSIFDENSELLMGIFMHYPNQILRGIKMEHSDPKRKFAIHGLVIVVDSLDVLRRRNTRTSKCYEDYKNYDELVLKNLADKIGCYPIHWQVNQNYPKNVCINHSQMRGLLTPSLRVVNSKFLKPFPPPCNQIQTISYSLKEYHEGQPAPPHPKLPPSYLAPPHPGLHPPPFLSSLRPRKKSYRFIFQNPHYKEILHVQSFNIESWIGNVGGYIGLFLGVSIWQLPNLVKFIFEKVKSMVNFHYTDRIEPTIHDVRLPR